MQNKELDNFTTKQSRTYIKHIRLGTNESWEGESEWKLAGNEEGKSQSK